jgi:hypothetical protein
MKFDNASAEQNSLSRVLKAIFEIPIEESLENNANRLLKLPKVRTSSLLELEGQGETFLDLSHQEEEKCVTLEAYPHSGTTLLMCKKEDSIFFALLHVLALSVELNEQSSIDLPSGDKLLRLIILRETFLDYRVTRTDERMTWVLWPDGSSETNNQGSITVTYVDENTMILNVGVDTPLHTCEFTPTNQNPLAYPILRQFIRLFGK